MSADTDLRDALIEAFDEADSYVLGSPIYDVKTDKLADLVLAVIKNWTVELPDRYVRPRKANEPDSFWYWRKLGLGTRATCVLLRADIKDLAQLMSEYTTIDWARQGNCGPKTVAEISAFVETQA